GEQVEIGKRISGQAATGTTITGLDPTQAYDVYVVAVSSIGETFPAATVAPATDITDPTVSANPNGGSTAVAQEVTLTASEPGAEIYYTTDGSDVIMSGGGIADSATRYTGPFSIAATTNLVYAAIDPSGNASDNMRATFTITNDPVPAAPTFTAAPVAGKGTATVTWTAPDAGGTDLTITGYSVQAYTADGTAFGSPQTVDGDVTTLEYGGLSRASWW
uniref:chitobiase/beta-hexosaminidase C-terminal domain-containing protein n=1 Tax=Arthrobacter sp. H41 TaxID=1312978 RepID=UPI0020A69FFC